MAIRPRAAAIMRRPEPDYQAAFPGQSSEYREGGDAAARDGVEMVIEAGPLPEALKTCRAVLAIARCAPRCRQGVKHIETPEAEMGARTNDPRSHAGGVGGAGRRRGRLAMPVLTTRREPAGEPFRLAGPSPPEAGSRVLGAPRRRRHRHWRRGVPATGSPRRRSPTAFPGWRGRGL